MSRKFNLDRFEAAVFETRFFFNARSPCFSLPLAIYFGRGVAKVNGVEKCVLKARLEKEREKIRAESAVKILRLSIMAALSVTSR